MRGRRQWNGELQEGAQNTRRGARSRACMDGGGVAENKNLTCVAQIVDAQVEAAEVAG